MLTSFGWPLHHEIEGQSPPVNANQKSKVKEKITMFNRRYIFIGAMFHCQFTLHKLEVVHHLHSGSVLAPGDFLFGGCIRHQPLGAKWTIQNCKIYQAQFPITNLPLKIYQFTIHFPCISSKFLVNWYTSPLWTPTFQLQKWLHQGAIDTGYLEGKGGTTHGRNGTTRCSALTLEADLSALRHLLLMVQKPCSW